MNKKRVTYLALGAFVFAASCSKEAAGPDIYDWGDGKIYIRPSISNMVGSRAQDMTLDRLESFQVTCFNTPTGDINSENYLSPHFENATFVRKYASTVAATFESSPNEGPHDWPAENGLIHFFAFAPSLSALNADTTHLKRTSASYILERIRVNADIERQVDFITSEASGERWRDFAGGVDLNFSHQLCQVELKAWGDGSQYDFEIAGVRLGNPVVESDFVFADQTHRASSGHWADSKETVKDKVEYLYRGVGDRIYRINNSEHNTADKAGSIMGQGVCAMVIPTVNPRWEGLADPDITNPNYTTERMYFSILTRVTDHESGNVVYPYPDDKSGMTTVTYALDASGNILARLYKGLAEGSYFTDEELESPYVMTEGVKVKDFGWAAVPVDADWSPGKRYVYTLDYSSGIGLHDPEDPDPGKPIKGKTAVEWGVTVDEWNYAEKNEDFEPDVDVP